MVDLRIRIIADPTLAKKGLEQVDRSINRTITNAERLRRALLGALQLFGLAAVIRQLLEFADAAQRLENRIRLVTSSQVELIQVTDELFAIANRTRIEYELTAEVYARVASASKNLGVSQRQLLEFTESVNQAVAISGATFEEAHNALIQFSQGIARGQLRGDELRSVLEQLPAVADVIAKHFGVSRGQIILFAEQGKITAETILDAFKEAREELAGKFAKTIPTISQAMTVLRNRFIQVADEFNKATGVIGKIAQTILGLANNAEILARSLVFLTTVIVTLLVNKGLALAARALTIFFVSMATNPVAALAFAIITLSSALIAFGDQLEIGNGHLANLQDLAVVVFEDITEVVKDFASVIVELFPDSMVDDAKSNLENILRIVAQFVGKAANLFVALGKSAIRLFDNDNIEPTLDLFTVTVLNAFIGLFEKILDLTTALTVAFGQAIINIGVKAADGVRKGLSKLGVTLPTSIGAADKKAEKSAVTIKDAFLDAAALVSKAEFLPRIPVPKEVADLGKKVKEDFLTGLNTFSPDDIDLKFDELLDRADARAIERNRSTETQRAISIGVIEDPLDTISAIQGVTTASLKLDEALAKLNRTREFETNLQGASSRARDVANQVRKIEEDLIKDGLALSQDERERLRITIEQTEAYKAQAAVLRDINGAQMDYADGLNDILINLSQHKIDTDQAVDAVIDLKIAVLEANKSLEGGLERGLLKSIQSMRDLSAASEELVTNAFAKLEETVGSVFTSLATSLFTSKANFSDFVKSLRGLFSELVDSILADLTKLLAKQALFALLNALTGGSSGLLTSLIPAASGAQNTSPGQPFLVGEEGPELFVPRQSGDIIPHGPSMAAIAPQQGGTTVVATPAPEVKVTVVNVTDPNDAIAALDSEAGGKVILNRLGKNRNAARRMLS